MTIMNENFHKLVAQTEDITEIADILQDSTELKSNIAKYVNEPFDKLFARERSKITMAFGKKGDTIYLLGNYKGSEDNSSILEVLYDAIEKGYVCSAHSLDGKGLFISLIESCGVKGLGFDITGDAEIEDREFLFNSANSAFLISVNSKNEGEFVDFIYNNGAELTLLGHVTKGEMRMDELSFGYINDFIS